MNMIEQSTDLTVKESQYLGRKLYVRERYFKMGPIEESFEGLNHFFCGYVELKPDDYYFTHSVAAEWDLPAWGGVTYSTDNYGQLSFLPGNIKFIGFDTMHPGLNLTKKRAIEETYFLAYYLHELRGGRDTGSLKLYKRFAPQKEVHAAANGYVRISPIARIRKLQIKRLNKGLKQ